MAPRESPRPKPRERTHHDRDRRKSHAQSPRKPRGHATTSEATSHSLSADALSKLDRLNQQTASRDVTPKKAKRNRQREVIDEKIVVERSRRQHKRKKRRVVSGALLEEGDSGRLRGLRGGHRHEDYADDARFKKKRLCRLHANGPNSVLTCATRHLDWSWSCRCSDYHSRCSSRQPET